MLRFVLEVLTVATVIATAGYAVAGAYQFIRRKLSKEAARPDSLPSEPAPALVRPRALSLGVPLGNPPEPPPASAELQDETNRGEGSMSSEEMAHQLRRSRRRYGLMLTVSALFWIVVLMGIVELLSRWGWLRHVLGTVIEHVPWLLGGVAIGGLLMQQAWNRHERRCERMFPGRREQNREYEFWDWRR